jgi:hypothetical protein
MQSGHPAPTLGLGPPPPPLVLLATWKAPLLGAFPARARVSLQGLLRVAALCLVLSKWLVKAIAVLGLRKLVKFHLDYLPSTLARLKPFKLN